MTDFLHRLAARTLGAAPVAQPLIPTLFAPAAAWQEMVEPVEPTRASQAHFSATPGPSEERKQATLPTPIVPSSAVPSAADGAALALRSPTPPHDVPAFKVDATPNTPAEPSPAVPAPVARRVEPAPSQAEPIVPRQPAASSPSIAEPIVRPVLDIKTTAMLAVAPPLAKAVPAPGKTDEVRLAPLPLPDPGVEASVGSQPPVIRVTIGRIDVRAVYPPAAAAPPAPKKAPPGGTSLDDYLKQRSEGKR